MGKDMTMDMIVGFTTLPRIPECKEATAIARSNNYHIRLI